MTEVVIAKLRSSLAQNKYVWGTGDEGSCAAYPGIGGGAVC